MAQAVLAPKPPTWGNYLSGEWSVEELRLRIDHNIANRDAWRILKDQEDDIKSGILTTLYRYAITWTPEDEAFELDNDEDDSELEDGEFENLPLDAGKIIELYTAAEIDFEKGLKFVREVEKGSHLKPNTIPSFRSDALKALCEVVQIALEKLDPEPEGDEEEDDSETDEEDYEDEDDEEDATLSSEEAEHSSRNASDTAALAQNERHMTKERILQLEADESAKEQQQHRDLIDKVYQSSEDQFKARLQLLVHQYRLKEKKALKK
jgi:septum formation topological specificity factor MinE